MTNRFSAFWHPITFTSSLFTDFRALDDSVYAKEAAAADDFPDLALTLEQAKFVDRHVQGHVNEIRELLKRAESRRDSMITLCATLLGGIAAVFKLFEHPPSCWTIGAFASILLALVVLTLSRRSIRMPISSRIDETIRSAPSVHDDHLVTWTSLSAHKWSRATSVVSDAWAAHIDLATWLLISGLICLFIDVLVRSPIWS